MIGRIQVPSRLAIVILGTVLVALLWLLACGEEESGTVPVAKQPAAPAEAPTAQPVPNVNPSQRPTPRPPSTPEPAPTAPRPTSTSTPTPEATPLSIAGQIPPTATPSPTSIPVLPTPLPAAMQAKLLSELDHEYRERCRHYMRENEQPVTYMEFKELDPESMTDLERVLWGGLIGDQGAHGICRDYWSEPLSVRNANKRNDSFRNRCYAELWDGHQRVADAKFLHFDQYARIANWLDIPGEELIEMSPQPLDLVIAEWEGGGGWEVWQTYPPAYPTDEWAGLFQYSGHGDRQGAWPGYVSRFEGQYPNSDCARYYPQLFLGRWVPLDTAVILKQVQDEAARTTPTPQPADLLAWINQRDRPVYIAR